MTKEEDNYMCIKTSAYVMYENTPSIVLIDINRTASHGTLCHQASSPITFPCHRPTQEAGSWRVREGISRDIPLNHW